MRPAADQDQVRSPAAVPQVSADQCVVQLTQHGKYHLDPLIGQRRFSIFDLSPLHIADDVLENGHPDMPVIRLALHYLGKSRHGLVFRIAHDLKVASQYTWVSHQHALLNITIFKYVQYLVGNMPQQLSAGRIIEQHIQTLRPGVPLIDIPHRRFLRVPSG